MDIKRASHLIIQLVREGLDLGLGVRVNFRSSLVYFTNVLLNSIVITAFKFNKIVVLILKIILVVYNIS